MSLFCNAVIEISGVVPDDCHPGLQALRPSDRKKIDCEDNRSLADSVCLDDALIRKYPQAARWDYGIGLKKGQHVQAFWVEVHPARSGEDVQSIVDKAKWLKARIKESPDLWAMTHTPYHWIASGKVKIPRSGRWSRLLKKHGVCHPQEKLWLS